MAEPGQIRRVVTGHDKNGKAIIISDGPATSIKTHPNRPGHKSTDIWKTTAMPVPIAAVEPDPTQGPRDFVPVMGTKIRIAEIPPEPAAFRNLTPAQAREFFKSGGNESASTFREGRRVQVRTLPRGDASSSSIGTPSAAATFTSTASDGLPSPDSRFATVDRGTPEARASPSCVWPRA